HLVGKLGLMPDPIARTLVQSLLSGSAQGLQNEGSGIPLGEHEHLPHSVPGLHGADLQAPIAVSQLWVSLQSASDVHGSPPGISQVCPSHVTAGHMPITW